MITGTKIRLRALERSDLPKICQWLNDEEVMYYDSGHPGNTASLAEVEHWLDEELERRPLDRKDYIIETLDGVAIGRIDYKGLSVKHRDAELGIHIGEKDYWEKGYGTDAIMTFLNYLFNELQLHRVWLGTASYNTRAQRCYEKCGFVKEGVSRERRFVNGKYYDSINMAIVRHEFNQQVSERDER